MTAPATVSSGGGSREIGPINNSFISAIDVHGILRGLLDKVVDDGLHVTRRSSGEDLGQCRVVNELVGHAGRSQTVNQDDERQRPEEGPLRHPGNHLQPLQVELADLHPLPLASKEVAHPSDDGVQHPEGSSLAISMLWSTWSAPRVDPLKLRYQNSDDNFKKVHNSEKPKYHIYFIYGVWL